MSEFVGIWNINTRVECCQSAESTVVVDNLHRYIDSALIWRSALFAHDFKALPDTITVAGMLSGLILN